MSKLRSLNTAFWSDPWIEDLTPTEKLLFIYLITNEKTNMLGIYEASIKKISFETGINKETVDKALKGFERVGKVKYTNNYIILVNYLKHQHFNTNMMKSAIDVYNNLPNHLKDSSLNITKNNPSEGFESLLNHFGMVRKVEVEEEVEKEVEEEEEIEDKKEDKDEIIFPFNSEYFIQQWEIWKDYKYKEFKFEYKSKQSEQAALTQLNNLSNGQEDTAIKIIHQSLANGYKGLFELKNNNYGKSKNERVAKVFEEHHPDWDEL